MEGKSNVNYRRVIPRDLFNEAKLLKCLGQLSLLIHDGQLPELQMDRMGAGFEVALHEAGYLTAEGLVIEKIDIVRGNTELWFGTVYNSRQSFPLICFYDWEEIKVFTETGSVSQEFKDFLKNA